MLRNSLLIEVLDYFIDTLSLISNFRTVFYDTSGAVFCWTIVARILFLKFGLTLIVLFSLIYLLKYISIYFLNSPWQAICCFSGSVGTCKPRVQCILFPLVIIIGDRLLTSSISGTSLIKKAFLLGLKYY